MSSPMQWEKNKNLLKVIKQERQLNWDKPGFVIVLVLFCFFSEAESEEEVKKGRVKKKEGGEL